MSHCRTPSFNNHLDHNFVVFKHMSQSFLMRRLDFGGNTINMIQIIDHSLRLLSFLKREVVNEFHVCSLTSLPVLYHSDSCFEELSDSINWSHKSSAGMPSNLNPASKEMISDSVELCKTEVCFLHIHPIGTNVWLPKTHNVLLGVDFGSSKSPAKSESWNSLNLHCFAVFPAWQYCGYSHVWWM